ncbi:hypothetical protein Ssi02_53710 [Sinosporangium siamense]|uniref:Uncharacterized protein n=2 Tax=Sinosporangium siamense TaxID=1367973 RepID=A0A919RJS4_9ACTN|nr:hypothetical protein Ssi02_53710 [Sinosporangium siamense]
MLTYTVITDPAPLVASEAGRKSKSTGTVYLLVTNTGQTAYSKITVTVPVGTDAGHLTQDITTITPKGEYTDIKTGGTRSVTVQTQGSAFEVTDQGGKAISFGPGDYVVLTLENVTVAPKPGLAVLRVTEASSRSKTGKPRDSHTAVALVKTAPKEIPAPHSFLADNAVVDAGTKVTLGWEGSDDFTYEILFPGGRKTVPKVKHTGSHGPYSLVLDAADAPKRDTTYTLIASFGSRLHTLTTTVQVRNPILETLTATDGVTTPWVQGAAQGDGAFALLPGGVKVWSTRGSNDLGTLFAGEATVSGLAAGYVKGLNEGDGDITFFQGGVKVWRSRSSNDAGVLYAGEATVSGLAAGYVKGLNEGDGDITFFQGGVKVWRSRSSNDAGVLYAGEATVSGLAAEYVKGLNEGDGDITFLQGGVKVWRTRGSNDAGVLYADKADLRGVNTEWVQGRNNDDGWISFLRYGVQVYQGGTDNHGVVYADSIRAKDAPYGQGGGWINLHEEGITVYLSKDGSNGLGSVTARSFDH